MNLFLPEFMTEVEAKEAMDLTIAVILTIEMEILGQMRNGRRRIQA